MSGSGNNETIYGSSENLTLNISLLHVLQEEVSQLTYEKANLTNTLRRLEEDVSETEKVLTKENNVLKKEINRLQGFELESTILKEKVAQLSSVVEAKDTELVTVYSNHESAKNLISKLEDELRTKNEIISILRTQHGESCAPVPRPTLSSETYPPLPTWSMITGAGKPTSTSSGLNRPNGLSAQSNKPKSAKLHGLDVDCVASGPRPNLDNCVSSDLNSRTHTTKDLGPVSNPSRPSSSARKIGPLGLVQPRPIDLSNKYSVLSDLVEDDRPNHVSKIRSCSRTFYNQSKKPKRFNATSVPEEGSKPSPKIAVIGDSHARGLADILNFKYLSNGEAVSVVKPGAKLGDLQFALQKYVEGLNTQTVILLGGANNLYNGNLAEAYETARKILCTLKSNIIVVNIPLRIDFPLDHPINLNIINFNLFLNDFCNSLENTQYIDICTSTPKYFNRDGVHLNSTGKEHLCKLIANKLGLKNKSAPITQSKSLVHPCLSSRGPLQEQLPSNELSSYQAEENLSVSPQKHSSQPGKDNCPTAVSPSEVESPMMSSTSTPRVSIDLSDGCSSSQSSFAGFVSPCTEKLNFVNDCLNRLAASHDQSAPISTDLSSQPYFLRKREKRMFPA